MRAAVKYLAPLIVLPFLACDSSPLETDTELSQPASDLRFKSDQTSEGKPPSEPGIYVLVTHFTCRKHSWGHAGASTDGVVGYAYEDCGKKETTLLNWYYQVPDYFVTVNYGMQVFRGEEKCEVSGTSSWVDLPKTLSCWGGIATATIEGLAVYE